MKILILKSTLFLIMYSFSIQAQTKDTIVKPEPVNIYKNAIGFKWGALISYRHYFKNIVLEYDFLPSNGGYFGFCFSNGLSLFYQKNSAHRVQPYFGLGINLLVYPHKVTDVYHHTLNSVSANPVLKAGFEVLSKKRRISGCFDIGYSPIASNNNYLGFFNHLSIDLGLRFRFTKSKK